MISMIHRIVADGGEGDLGRYLGPGGTHHQRQGWNEQNQHDDGGKSAGHDIIAPLSALDNQISQ
jgi:hypothetical protein